MAVAKPHGHLIRNIHKSLSQRNIPWKTKQTTSLSFQRRRQNTVLYSKHYRPQHCTEKQRNQKDLFCKAEGKWNRLPPWIKEIWRDFSLEWNDHTGENIDYHSLWMKLYMKQNLAYFLIKYCNATLDPLKIEERETDYLITTRLHGDENINQPLVDYYPRGLRKY